MIALEELQHDALGEIFNIGVGRAAASLSTIVNETVDLAVPAISLCTQSEMRALLSERHFDKVSAVSQHFSGPFEATTMLLFPEAHALEIVRLMIGSADLTPEEISEYEQESLCEIGNIILNACISSLADNFGVEIMGGLPTHHFGTPQNLILCGHDPSHGDPMVLLLKVSMSIKNSSIEGHILFLMSVESLSALIHCLDGYLRAQGLC